jgi:hypothetical protein
MTAINIPGFKGGIDNVSPETALAKGFCRDAQDVILNRAGEVESRSGKRRLTTQTGMHSLFFSRMTGISLCLVAGWLCRVKLYQGELTLEQILEVGEPGMSYTEMDGAVWCSNGEGIWKVTVEQGVTIAVVITLPVPVITVTAANTGGLAAGQYAAAVSFLDEFYMEGALSPMQFVEVSEGGGVNVTVTWPDHPSNARLAVLHLSPPNGDQIHRVLILQPSSNNPSSDTERLGSEDRLGILATARNTQPMPAGTLIRAWRGRLLTATGNVLYWSDALRYGINDSRHGWMEFRSSITMIEPVDGGVFIGTTDEVIFLSGTTPKEWTRKLTSAPVPFAGCSGVIPHYEFGGELDNGDLPLAIWLSSQGWVIGMPDGSINAVQADRISLLPQTSGHFGWYKRRVWAALSG